MNPEGVNGSCSLKEFVQNEKRMKSVGLVSNTSWSIYNFRLGLIRALKKEGYKIIVIAPKDDFTSLLKKEQIIYEPLSIKNYSINPFHDFQTFRCLNRLYKKHALDFIFHYTVKPNIYGTFAAYLNQIPSIPVITGLGHLYTKRSIRTTLVKILYKLSLSNTKEVWFLNESDASIFTESKIIPESKVRFLPSEGVNTKFYTPLKEEKASKVFRFLFAGRLIAEKGVYEYIKAARILKKECQNVRFNLLGFLDKNNPSAIKEEEINRWVSEGIITYLGATKDVRLFLDQSECVVLPSYYREGVPRILLEAASMKVPIISTNNVGCRKVVQEGLNGMLCSKKNTAQLVDCMRTMTKLPFETRQTYGENGRELVKTFFEEKVVIAQYLKRLENTIGVSKDSVYAFS